MNTQSKRLSAIVLAATALFGSESILAECPEGKVEVIRTTPSGKTHVQCVSNNALGGIGQAADNSAGSVSFATFTPLGELPGGSYSHQMWDISADGTTIVGVAKSAEGSEAFRWTEADGMVGLGDFEGGDYFSIAFGVSGDGSIVVGWGRDDNPSQRAFRWSTALNGMVPLDGVDCSGSIFNHSGAYGVSGDGTIIAGECNGTIFRWTESGGMETLYEGQGQTRPFDMSLDGSVIVGWVDNGQPPFSGISYEAFRWTQSGGMAPLGTLTPPYSSTGFGVSPDGSVVVGRSNFTAFQWTLATGMVALPGSNSYARDASQDGTVIVGDLFCGDSGRAVIWLQGGNPLLVQELLESQGVDLSGWWLTSVRAVTPDGRTIAGEGVINPPATCELIDDDADKQLWVATLPLP